MKAKKDLKLSLTWPSLSPHSRNHIFYDNVPLRDKRSGCTWDPRWGKSRLLYDCVWIVSDIQLWANPASTLDERPGGSKFASRKLADKLHLSCLICALRATFQLVASHESTSPSAALVHRYQKLLLGSYNSFAKPNYLALPLSRMSPRGCRWVALLEDSNLVDPASSHMLVSKTKPCMSKYKCYTVKLRMAH